MSERERVRIAAAIAMLPEASRKRSGWSSSTMDDEVAIAVHYADALVTELGLDFPRPDWVCVARRLGPGTHSTHIVTLHDPSSARWFAKGSIVRACPDPFGNAMRTGDCEVVSADQSSGIVKLDNAHRICAFADGDYLFVESR